MVVILMMWMMVPPAQPLSRGLPSVQDISTCKMLQPPGFSSLRTKLTLFTMAGLQGSLSEWTCSPRSLKPPRTSPFLKLYHLPIPAQFNTFYYIGSANVSLAYITPLLPNCKLFQLKTLSIASLEKLVTTTSYPYSPKFLRDQSGKAGIDHQSSPLATLCSWQTPPIRHKIKFVTQILFNITFQGNYYRSREMSLRLVSIT